MMWWEILKNAKISGKAKGKGSSFDASKIKINLDNQDDCNKKLQQWAKNAKKITPILPNLYSNNKWFRENFRKKNQSVFMSSYIFKGYEADYPYTEFELFHIDEDIQGVYNTVPEKVACKAISQFNSNNLHETSEVMGYTIKTWRGKSSYPYSKHKNQFIEISKDGIIFVDIGVFLETVAYSQKYYPDANEMDIIEDLIEWDKEFPKWWI